jgi:hypothetical protein
MIFKRLRDLATRPQAPSSTLGRGDVVPADSSWKSRVGASGGAIVDKATRIYKDNPKTVGGVALIAGALLLNHLRRPVR